MTLPRRGPQLASALAALTDAEVTALLSTAEPLGIGIGGSTSRVRVQGADVFVKQLPLTDVEKGDPTSTANVFDLPVACHYGIGSPGFGVGREIAAHEITSRWVSAGATDIFPVLSHWRVLDQGCRTDLSEFEGSEAKQQWGASWPRVLRRVEALAGARSSVVLFLEYLPVTLEARLRSLFAAGCGAAALSDAIDQIAAAASWMDQHGLRHLDVHPRNILVRDGRLVFTDFGLALHRDFDQDPDERAFFATHGGYDRDSGITSLLHWVLAEVGIGPRARRLAALRAAASDPAAVELAPVRAALGDEAAVLLAEHAAVALAVLALQEPAREIFRKGIEDPGR